MFKVKIKLCGMMEQKDIDAANALKPDFVGYIFAPGRQRTITPDLAHSFTARLNKDITPVGVFKNNDSNDIITLARAKTIALIQLHGGEDEDFILSIKEATQLPVIKAFGIAGAGDIIRANKSPADMVLLDTPGGGTGLSFDHSLLSGMERDYFMAGGLTPDNVTSVLNNLKGRLPYALDVSSGIETDGRKDVNKMIAFVKAVKETRKL